MSSEDRNKPTARLGAEAALQITHEVFPGAVIRDFVEDYIVPALVESYLRNRVSLPEQVGCEHTVDQL